MVPVTREKSESTMSRIGKQPIAVPAGAEVEVKDRRVQVKGPSGTLAFTCRPEVSVSYDTEAKQVVVERRRNDRKSRAMHGTTRAIIANMCQGVTEGYTRELEITGVGWNARLTGNEIELNVGFADTKKVSVPESVNVTIEGARIKVSGVDKQKVGQLAARIRQVRPPEPYNGKGIRYLDERVIRKEGKAFAGGGS